MHLKKVQIFHLRNEFDFWNVHGIMNTSGLLQNKWSPMGSTVTLQGTLSIHDSMNIPKIEFIAYIYINYKYLIYRNYVYLQFRKQNSFVFLAHLSQRLMGELIVYQWLRRPSVHRPSICQHFQTSSPLKPLGQLNSNCKWWLLRMRERNCVQMDLVTWPRWPPRPYMVKTL